MSGRLIYIRNLISIAVLLAGFAGSEAASNHPLEKGPDDVQRNYWLPKELNRSGTLKILRNMVGNPAIQFSGSQNKPVDIALIYPSADVSDFWVRNDLAMTRRLDEMGIAYRITKFVSRQIEHALQTDYITQVVLNAENFDYVVFGPSELAKQIDNIDKLAKNSEFKTYVWAFHTPPKQLAVQPATWFDFSSTEGALKLCNHLMKRLGDDVLIAMNRGMEGITDHQRSTVFKDCVVDKGNWNVQYEHNGDYQRSGGFDGTNKILQSYPDVTVIHNANTAMALGSVDAQTAANKTNTFFTTGWGGTKLELDMIRRGELNATPMRMGDDVGIATAEAIKADLESRADDMPRVFLGRITIAHDKLKSDELDALEQEAFRYSGESANQR